MECRILGPRSGAETVPPTVEGQSFNLPLDHQGSLRLTILICSWILWTRSLGWAYWGWLVCVQCCLRLQLVRPEQLGTGTASQKCLKWPPHVAWASSQNGDLQMGSQISSSMTQSSRCKSSRKWGSSCISIIASLHLHCHLSVEAATSPSRFWFLFFNMYLFGCAGS